MMRMLVKKVVVLAYTLLMCLRVEQPAEISWSLNDESDNVIYEGGAPFDTLACIADGRYMLDMSDTNAAGTANGWDYGEFIITQENGFKLFRHTIIGNRSDSSSKFRRLSNQAPIADEIEAVELELGQTADFVLSGSDADNDLTTIFLHQAPAGGEIHSYLPGAGIVGEYFAGGGTGVGIAISPDQKYAYLADHGDGLKVLDITDLTRPLLIGTGPIDSGGQYNVSVSNDGKRFI